MPWWKLGAIIVVFMIVAIVTAFALGLRQAQFSAREEAIKQALDPKLASLVVHEGDLAAIPADFRDCNDGMIDSGIQYDFERDGDGDSGEVKDAEIVENEYSPKGIIQSEFCDRAGGSWVSAILWLAPSKDSVIYYTQVHADLPMQDPEALERLVEADVESYYPDNQWSDAAWIDVSTLGTNGYAFRYRVQYPDGDELVLHHYVFMRGVVFVTVSVRMPVGASEDLATDIAVTQDERLKAEIRAISAQVQVP